MTRQGQILAIAALVFIFFNHVNGRGLDRSRRSADNLTEAIVLTNAEISSIVSLHNNLREQQSATNMKRLTWDADLATFAQNHLSTCPDGHSSGTAGGFSSIGENIGTSRTSSTTYDRTFITTVTQSWYDEISFYTYVDQTCESGRVCGHYTQVVWADTYRIGCAAVFCADSSPFHHKTIVSCNYGPAGNIINATTTRTGTPFQSDGAVCSACDVADICNNGLCSSATRDVSDTGVDDCASNGCLNGGTCTNGTNSYSCACVNGYTGTNCATNIDDCASTPCLNGGTCTDGVASFTCACVNGYTGADCSTNIDDCASTPCLNGGTCTDGVASFTCACVNGYTGLSCQSDINECTAVTHMCVLGSTCINNPGSYTCQCPAGTFGDGITGCTNIDYCQGVDCVNGSCVNLPTSYECQCNSGWTKSPGGAVCDTDVLECTLDPSRCNNGQCIEQLGSFSCSCQAGWEGSACNTNINECSGNMNNCDGNATCADTAGSFTCACNAGYRGDGLTCYEYILFLLPNPTTITNRNRNRRIRFDIPIPFGSEFFDSLFISENGVILFSRNNQNRVRNAEFATPIQNPSGNIRFIAPFWDNLAGGTLRFQLDQNSAGIGNTTCDLPRINDLIRNHLSINFTAKMVLRIEWDALTIFPQSLYPNSASTFQTIILSDGLKTIVLFAYQGGLMTYVPDSTQRTASNVGMGFYNNLGSQHYSTGNYFPHLGSNIGTNGLYLYLFDPGTTRETSCINWYNTQSLPWITPFRFSCPWTLFQMFRDRRWLYQFRADVFKQSYPSYFRRNSVCFQRTFGLIGSPAGPRCCYHTHSGAFLVGSHSHYELYQFPSFLPQSNYNASYNSYLNNEIIPYDNCCNAREDVFPYYCGLYEAVRPKTFSFLYRPQRFSWFFGDPHVVNLFNVEYTFNGLGEFYLIYLPSQFVLQGRTERAVNANGTQTEATFFTSFVARDTVNNYTVAFAPNQYNNDTVITINGQVKTFPAVGQSEAVGTLVLQQPNATQYYVGFSADIALTAFVVDGVISIQISSSTTFNTMARGLFGDFYFRNGTQLNVNDLKLNITGRDSFLTGSIDQEKVYPMGKSWQVNETESLFTYPDGRNYTFYNPSNHTPPFLTAEVAALNNATLQLYLSTCGRDNLACLYDYAVTRNQQLALASGNIANEARQLHTIATNQAPTLTYEANQTTVVVEGTIRAIVGQTINIQFNGSDADGDTLTYSLNNNEIAGTSINGSGYFTFVVTSSNLNINVTSGVPTLLVQVVDGLASAVVEVKVLVCDCAGNGTCLWDRPLQLGTSSYGVVSCQCDPAYTGLRCTEDEDGCLTNPCFGACTDNPAPAANFTCEPCPSNMTGNGTTCVDRDECAEGIDSCAQNCTNTAGSFNCSCRDGYIVDPMFPNNCLNVNECTNGSPCASFGAASCRDNNGSFSCVCNSGYQMNAEGNACLDIPECNNTNTCNTTTSQCSETPGSYQCTCKNGYEKPSNSSPQSNTCMNINECNNTQACRNANCTDLPGTFRCDCWYSYIRQTAQSCIPRNITRCVNVTCEVGQECQEDEFGHGTCQCQTTHHRHNDTCLPRYRFVQRTIETFQAAFNNLTSPQSLEFIGRFKMVMLPLAGATDIVALIVTNLQPGSVIVSFDILVGPGSAATPQQEILTTIIQSINSNNFNTSLFIGLPRGGEVNITGVCPPLVDRSTIDQTTLQNNKLNANMTCQSSLVGISIDVCNLTNIGILPTELVVATHGANLSAVATQCKPTILRTVDGKLSATFIISNIFDCGAIAAMDAQTLTLSYNIQTVPPTVSSSSQIQRYYDTSVIFNCSFARSEIVNSPLLMPQLQRIQLAQPAVSGRFDISLMLCQDENCATSLQGNPPTVHVSEYVYFKAALPASDLTVLQARECWATPTSNSTNPTRYPIIESGCPSNADPSSISVVKNFNGSFVTAGFKSFAWVGINDQKIFIHCQLDVCVNSAANCSGPVCSPGKKKRAVQNYHEGKLYSFGPLKLVTPCDEPGTCDHQCTLHNGEPICSCYAGFTLDSDGKSCVKITPEEKQTSWISVIIVIVVFVTALYLGLNSMFTKPKKSSKVLTT